MQVNNIQSSQNFGMAFKIGHGAEKTLAVQPLDALRRIQKAGSEMVSHEHVDVILQENGDAWVKTKNAVYGKSFLAHKPKDARLFISTHLIEPKDKVLPKGHTDDITVFCDLVTKESAMKAYEELNSTDNHIVKATEFAKVLEESIELEPKLKNLRTAQLRQKQEERKKILEDLFARFTCE